MRWWQRTTDEAMSGWKAVADGGRGKSLSACASMASVVPILTLLMLRLRRLRWMFSIAGTRHDHVELAME
jgi:phage-related minor tail protein